jgi:acetyl esterase/lipase
MNMNIIKTIGLGLVLSLLAGNIYAQPPGGFPGGGMPGAKTEGIKNNFLDIAYADKSAAEKLDIYLPNEGTGPFPVIISIHGGGFEMGDKADGQVNPMLEGLKHGYAVVSVNYRLSSEAKFPAQIQDVKAAIRFIRANAAKYHLNPDKIAAWGGSAGGNLSALVGTTGDVTLFDNSGLGNPTQSSKVQAVVDWFGPIMFSKMDEEFTASGNGKADHSAANSPESKLLGKQLSEVPELVKQASPASYISENAPPFFIEHGTKDMLVPTQQSIQFSTELAKVLGQDKVTLTLLEGANHGGPQFETPENLAKVFAFLDHYLK